MQNKTSVVIDGQVILLKSEEDAEHVQRLARYVDGKISEIKKQSVTATLDDKARTVIYALNIADDYIKANDKLTRIDAVHKKFVTDNGQLQKENGILSASVKALEAEVKHLRNALAEAKAYKPDTKPESGNTKPSSSSRKNQLPGRDESPSGF